MRYFYTYQTTIGPLCITADGEYIYKVRFSAPAETSFLKRAETPLIGRAIGQIEEFLRGDRREFDLPLRAEGTDFQMLVWGVLRTIPYGEVWSYKRVAQAVGNPKASRAVGMANNRNPLAVVVPCHRVIGADGKLVGYAGGLPAKESLLELEKCK